MPRRLFSWWFFAEATVARLTSPETDCRASDADVRAAIGGSRVLAFVQAFVTATERAWDSSYARRFIEGIGSAALESQRRDRIRLAGACASVAAVTVLLLLAVASDAGPLRWILPVAIGVLGVSVAAAADPIARAWEAKRRR